MAFSDKLAEWRESLESVDLQQLDLENPGTWPAVVKGLTLVLLFVLCLAAGHFFVLSGQFQAQENARNKEDQLRAEYKSKAFQAANLDALRAQMEEMEETFGALVSQLPSDTQVPGLLEDITSSGVNNGLELDSIELQEEVSEEFFIELPIEIEVSGAYHDIGAFVSGISGLPRSVTLHDFDISPAEEEPGVMKMSILAKTYRYKELGE